MKKITLICLLFIILIQITNACDTSDCNSIQGIGYINEYNHDGFFEEYLTYVETKDGKAVINLRNGWNLLLNRCMN